MFAFLFVFFFYLAAATPIFGSSIIQEIQDESRNENLKRIRETLQALHLRTSVSIVHDSLEGDFYQFDFRNPKFDGLKQKLFEDIRNGSLRNIEWLIKLGAHDKDIYDVDSAISEGKLNSRKKKKGDLGESALILACQYNRTDVVAMLLANPSISGTNYVNFQGYNGRTALMIAAKMDNIEVARMLFQHHPEVNIQDYFKNTALMIATRRNNSAIVDLILNLHYQNSSALNVNVADRHGKTAFMDACHLGYPNIVEMFLAIPSTFFNVADRFGNSALLFAALSNHTEVVSRLLLVPYIDVNARNKLGMSPLMYSAWNRNIEMFEKLLANKEIDVNLAGLYKNTVLMYASQRGYTDLVERLMEHPDIDVDVEDNFNMTAVMYAEQNGYYDLAVKLEK